jgi:hypothetical protein
VLAELDELSPHEPLAILAERDALGLLWELSEDPHVPVRPVVYALPQDMNGRGPCEQESERFGRCDKP